MGETCWLRKFNLQNFHAELASEEARRQLEKALCIVKKSELSATISAKASIHKHTIQPCPERDLGAISLFFVTEWSKKWRFRIKSGGDGESGVQAAKDSGYEQEFSDVDIGWQNTE